MASPVDAGRAITSISTAADPWTVNLPGSIAAGDLLIIVLRTPSGVDVGNVGEIANWKFIGSDASDATDDLTNIYAKQATGSEGATMSWDMGSSTKGAVIVWRITGALVPPAAVVSGGSYDQPDWGGVTTGTAANIDPTSFTPDNPPGTQDYLWLSFVGMDSETATASNGTLSNVVSANSGTGGAVASNCIIWGGSIASTASSIDIAAWTSSAPANGVTAITLAVQPPVVASTLILEQGYVDFADPGVL